MRTVKWAWIAVIIAATTSAPAAQDGPATRPAGGVVRGHVSIKTGALFQQPNLGRVVIYLGSDENLDRKFGPTTRAVVAQRDKSFVPNFVVVPRNTEVEFPNWDHFDHNVFSKSAAAPAFDLDRYPYGQSKTRTFEKLGVVQVFCNIHPSMRAMVYVTPSTLFARPDKDGDFEISGIPDGSYQLCAWNERCEDQRLPVTISSSVPAKIDFLLVETRDRIIDSSENRGDGYGVERGLGVKRARLDLPVVHDAHPAPADSNP